MNEKKIYNLDLIYFAIVIFSFERRRCDSVWRSGQLDGVGAFFIRRQVWIIIPHFVNLYESVYYIRSSGCNCFVK